MDNTAETLHNLAARMFYFGLITTQAVPILGGMQNITTPYEAALRLRVGLGDTKPIEGAPLDSPVRRRTFRPHGTPDWHLLIILEGDFVMDEESGHPTTLSARSAALFPPHTRQDYMLSKENAKGRFFWAHFFPEASLLPLIEWPQGASGWSSLQWSHENLLHDQILEASVRCDTYFRSNYNRKRSLALLALEEIFRLILQGNPLDQLNELDDRVAKTLQLIAKNIQQAITLKDLSAEVGLSSSRLCHVFTENMHCGVMEYIERQRIKIASGMLRNSQLPINQIAIDCGFSSPYYFSRRFHKAKGMTPTEYRSASEKQ